VSSFEMNATLCLSVLWLRSCVDEGLAVEWLESMRDPVVVGAVYIYQEYRYYCLRYDCRYRCGVILKKVSNLSWSMLRQAISSSKVR
jgi:hypothetical protein